MGEIRLYEGKINYGGEWLTTDDLTRMIQGKMQAGNMNFAQLAAALEELTQALDNAETINVKLVIEKDAYKKLKEIGGQDEREAIYKAIKAYVNGGATTASETITPSAPQTEVSDEPPPQAPQAVINCAKCSSPIEIPSNETPEEIRCPNCNAIGRLKKG